MMIGPTREDSKVVSQGELWKLWNQDSTRPAGPLSLSRLLPSFLAVSAFVSLFSLDSVSLFCSLPCFLLSLLSHSLTPFCLSSS